MIRGSAALAGVLLLIAAPPARAQFYGRSYPFYGGYYPGYFYGYNGFYANGFSMYGPPVPTYGTVPGYFGGADQRLNNYVVPPRPHRPYPATLQPLPAEIEHQVKELPQGGARPADDRAAAVIEVRLPVAAAEIWIDGEPTSQTGSLRSFQSPPLEKGKRFQYEIEARWRQDGQMVRRSETVVVEAGQRLQIDFRPRVATENQFLPPPQ